MKYFRSLRQKLNKRKDIDSELIKKAYIFARDAHKGQKRASGEDYIIHPVAVAEILLDIKADEESVIAALLHDVVEDTQYNLSSIEKKFGKSVALLVDGMSNFSKASFSSEITLDRKIESLRKWFQVMEKDVRVAVIRLADRLHNMQTISFHDKVKQERIAKETLDLYVKIAEKLGAIYLHKKLGDLCLFALYPEEHALLKKIQKSEKNIAKKLEKDLKTKIASTEISKKTFVINSETLSLWKMYENGVHTKDDVEGVLPLSFYITVPTTKDCYLFLYMIHSLWKGEDGMVHDYISTPKSSGYQALHTTIFYKRRLISFAILTQEMMKENEYGVTTFCFSSKKKERGLLFWCQHLSYVTKTSTQNSENFLEQLQHDILEETITVHTESKENLILPSKSTALDAAFYAYGKKALFTEEVFVNGETTPLYFQLKDNDNIKFFFSTKKKVDYNWLSYSETALAHSRMQKHLQDDRLSKADKISTGKMILEREFLAENKGHIDEIDKATLQKLLSHYNLLSLEELFLRIADGEIDPYEVTKYLNGKTKKTNECFSRISIVLNEKRKIEDIRRLIELHTHKIMRYLFSEDKDKFRITAHVSFLNKKRQTTLEKTLLENKEVLSARFLNRKDIAYISLMILGIVLLWGVEPVIIYYAYQNTSLTPINFSFIRIWGTLIPLFFWGILKIRKEKSGIIPFFNLNILLASFGLSIAFLFRYIVLQDTSPSSFMILYRYHILFTIFYFLSFASFLKNRIHFIKFFMTFIVANTLFFSFATELVWKQVVFTIIAALGFGILTINTRIFIKKFSVKARFYQFITLIYLYATIPVSLLAYFYKDAENFLEPLKNNLFLVISLSVIVVIPYIIMHQLNLRYSNFRYTAIALSFTWLVTLFTEMIFLDTQLNLFLLLAGLITAGSIYFITQINTDK